MVTVTNYHERVNADGKPFITLELQGDVEMVQSTQTGKFYVTARRCSIPSTFNKEFAQTLVGHKMPGKIEKVQTDPYEYTIKESGEIITLMHTYEYVPDGSLPASKKEDVLAEV